MSRLMAIDPGSEESAWVEWTQVMNLKPHAWTKMPNDTILEDVRHVRQDTIVVIEWTAPRGMPASAQLFETMWWAGRFTQAALEAGATVFRIERKVVVQHLTGMRSGKDSNVRAALIDRYGGPGGKEAAVGRKAKPGPLYGMRADMWAALAVGCAFIDGATVFG